MGLTSAEPIAAKAAAGDDDLVRRYATVATIATFLVVGTTGMLLFLHVGDRYLRAAHEWLGIAFVVASVFHMVRNWKPFVVLMKQPRAKGAIVLALVVTALFMAAAATFPEPRGRGSRHGEVAPASEVAVAAPAPISAAPRE